MRCSQFAQGLVSSSGGVWRSGGIKPAVLGAQQKRGAQASEAGVGRLLTWSAGVAEEGFFQE